ncbi:MAG: ferredoxin [Candidatus Cloacimonadota bacterium]|nr:MAG: ferredoxin [Candidatus Cloacimonadota bacterium]
MYKINIELCDICCSCSAVCPTDAIFYTEFYAKIEQSKCIDCGKCAILCPVSAIETEEATSAN